MLKSVVRFAAGAASAAAFAALSGCSQPPAEAPPPPPQAYQAPPPAQGLAGGPPPPAPSASAGLAGGPRRPVVVVHMAPIPNPGALSPAERARVYGPGRYTEHGGRGHARGGPAPTKTWRRADGTTVVAMRPVPNPEDMGARERARVYGGHKAAGHAVAPAHHAAPMHAAPAPVHAAAPAKPVVVSKPAPVTAAKPPPVVAAPPAANTVAAKPAPVVAAPPAVSTPAAPPMDPKLAKLQAAVGPAATNGATLTVADSIGKGQPGKVTLTLPQDLYATIKREAGKAGLAAAAKKTDISALLSGDGYTITPNGVQTVHLASGEAAKFDWLVTPLAGEKSALKAQVEAILAGVGKPQSFSLASIEQAVQAAEPAMPKEKTSAFALPDWLSIPGVKDVDLGFAKVQSKSLVAGLIALVILLILIMVVRGNGAARAREERRKKFRTLTDYGMGSEPEPTAEAHPTAAYEPPPTPSYATFTEPAAYSPPPPAPESHANYVNPMIAAAAGAAAGAAVTHAVDEHHARQEAEHAQPAAHVEAAPVEHHDAHHDDHHGDHPVEDAHVEEHHADAHHDDHAHGDHGHDAHGEGAHGDAAHAEHREPEHA